MKLTLILLRVDLRNRNRNPQLSKEEPYDKIFNI